MKKINKIKATLYPQYIRDFNRDLYKDVNKQEVLVGATTMLVIGLIGILIYIL